MKKQRNREKTWSLLYRPGDAVTDAAIAALAKESGRSEIVARLLYTRGYRSAKAIESFFHQGTACLHDPYLLRDIEPAVARIGEALANGEKIAIYGDYDVDGVTSVSLLYLYLSERGADVGYYIPSRLKEGYGLSTPAIDSLAERGVTLMITVDTGVTAIEEIAYAKERGIDTVVTDHHECRTTLPDAVAVVNPHRPDDSYPFKELAGVGVVFKLICAYEMSECRKDGRPEIDGVRRVCREFADLVAIGTIADVMPVIDENRLIVTLGLEQLQATRRPGLRALIDAVSAGSSRADVRGTPKKRSINSGFIGFTIAPRMNAAGRVSNASIAAELLLADDPKTAQALAEELCRLNTVRQVEENRIAEEAYRKIEQTLDENDRVIVIDDDGWQQGIIGIVSSRITERYGLPSILISFDGGDGEPMGDDIGKGSGRSVKGLNLVDALTDSEDLLVRFGGHELAAGLSICRANIDEFRRKINRYAKEHMTEEALSVSLDADCEVKIGDLTLTLAQELSAMEPFGISNPIPNFILRDATVRRIIPMSGGKHLRMIVGKDGVEMTAIWFGTSIESIDFAVGETVDILFQFSINEYQGVTSLQLIVQDMKYAADYEQSYGRAVARYEEIRAGAGYDASENVLPTRDDIAAVYTALRREFRAGRSVFSMRRLLSLLASMGQGEISYVKLKFIIRIMQELMICGVTEATDDTYVFEFSYQTSKTNIEKSSILRRLRLQQRKE